MTENSILSFSRVFWRIVVESGTVKLEGYPLVESLGADNGYDIGSFDFRLDGNGGANLEGYSLVESLGEYGGSDIVFQ